MFINGLRACIMHADTRAIDDVPSATMQQLEAKRTTLFSYVL